MAYHPNIPSESYIRVTLVHSHCVHLTTCKASHRKRGLWKTTDCDKCTRFRWKEEFAVPGASWSFSVNHTFPSFDDPFKTDTVMPRTGIRIPLQLKAKQINVNGVSTRWWEMAQSSGSWHCTALFPETFLSALGLAVGSLLAGFWNALWVSDTVCKRTSRTFLLFYLWKMKLLFSFGVAQSYGSVKTSWQLCLHLSSSTTPFTSRIVSRNFRKNNPLHPCMFRSILCFAKKSAICKKKIIIIIIKACTTHYHLFRQACS